MSGRFSWLRAFLRSYRRPVAVAVTLGLVASCFAALLMFTSGYLISATAMPGITLFSIMLPVAFVQVFGIGRPLARYLERLVSHDWVLHVTSDLRRMLYRHIAGKAADPAAERSSGEYLALLSDDIAHLQNLYLRVVFPSIVALLLAVGASVLFGFFSIALALAMALVFAVTVVLLPYATLLATRLRAEKAKELRGQLYEQVTDDILGSTDWLLAGRSSDALARGVSQHAAVARADAKLRAFDRAMELAATLVLGAAVCGVLAWSGANLGGDQASANWIAALVLGFFPLIESLAIMPGVVSGSTEYLQSVDRLKDISESGSDLLQLEPFPEIDGPASIGIRDVSYTYPGGTSPVLRAVDLAIEAGQSVAVLGPSGSGKSTLAAIARGLLEPQSGSVDIGGHVVKPRAHDLSRTVGFLSQEPYLFDKTLRDNLSMAAPGVEDETLVQLIGRVGLAERFEALPDGLDTRIGETGVGFSGGEAHRIALARVLAADVSAVLVDEPFAALDPATERELLDTLLEACADRTLVVITHHLAQIERFDRVVFLEDGRIALDGSPAELMATSTRFRDLVRFDSGA